MEPGLGLGYAHPEYESKYPHNDGNTTENEGIDVHSAPVILRLRPNVGETAEARGVLTRGTQVDDTNTAQQQRDSRDEKWTGGQNLPPRIPRCARFIANLLAPAIRMQIRILHTGFHTPREPALSLDRRPDPGVPK